MLLLAVMHILTIVCVVFIIWFGISICSVTHAVYGNACLSPCCY